MKRKKSAALVAGLWAVCAALARGRSEQMEAAGLAAAALPMLPGLLSWTARGTAKRRCEGRAAR